MILTLPNVCVVGVLSIKAKLTANRAGPIPIVMELTIARSVSIMRVKGVVWCAKNQNAVAVDEFGGRMFSTGHLGGYAAVKTGYVMTIDPS